MARRITSGRRPLKYASMDEVMPDVDRLLLGHRTLGQWSLGQICRHLSGVVAASAEGFPGLLPWLVRRTVGPRILRTMLTTEALREGVWLPEKIKPKPGLDARAEAETLRAAVRQFAARPDPPVEHPICGKLTRDQWDHFHRVHCAHHLSFVVPDGSG